MELYFTKMPEARLDMSGERHAQIISPEGRKCREKPWHPSISYRPGTINRDYGVVIVHEK